MGVRSNEASDVALRCGIVYRDVVTVLVLVEHVGMSMRECSSFNILSRDSHSVSVLDQGGKSKSLSSSPINILAVLNGLKSLFENLCNEFVEVLILRESSNLPSSLPNSADINT